MQSGYTCCIASAGPNQVLGGSANVFHPDLRVVTPGGELDKGQWEETVKGLLVKGVKATDFDFAKEEGATVFYSMTLAFPEGEQLRPSSKITIKDGQVLRVEPVDPAAYSRLVEDSS